MEQSVKNDIAELREKREESSRPLAPQAVAPPALKDTPERLSPQETSNSSSKQAVTIREDKLNGDGRLQTYIALAMHESPQLAAAFERWQSSVYQISRSRRLPDPTISFSYFIQSVETRVGPQQAKLSLKQSFPWPTRLSAGADAASAQARAYQKRFDALALAIEERIAAIYWNLWLIRETRDIHSAHLEVVRSLSQSVLARVATGSTTLADQQQVDLTAARLEDMLRSMDENETTAIAQLRAAIGLQNRQAMGTSDDPPPSVFPAQTDEELRNDALNHPLISSHAYLAQANDDRARAESATGMPTFTIGADWILTGKTNIATVADDGKDAVIVGAGMSIPLWQGSYQDSVDAAQSAASAQRAEAQNAKNSALAEVDSSLAAVRNAIRRVDLYQNTLVPQADSAYTSVLGAYATGRGTVAQTLLAQRDLLELRGELERARADYGISWARLEQVVGHDIDGAQERPSEKSLGKKDDN